jgi:hypothetical protein
MVSYNRFGSHDENGRARFAVFFPGPDSYVRGDDPQIAELQVYGSAAAPPDGAEVLTKRAQAERACATLSATGAPVSAGQLAAAAGLSASYARGGRVPHSTPGHSGQRVAGRRDDPPRARPREVMTALAHWDRGVSS